jgi:signal transduction histidine kinase
MIESTTAQILTEDSHFYKRYENILTGCQFIVKPKGMLNQPTALFPDGPVDIYLLDNVNGKFPFERLKSIILANHTKKFLLNVGTPPPKSISLPHPVITINEQTDQVPISVLLKNIDRMIRKEKAQLELSSMMLHDVRSPLNSLIGYLELLINGTFGQLNEGHKNIIEKAIDMGDTALDLLEELNEIYRDEQETFLVQKQEFNFLKLLESVLAIIWVKADKKNIQIKKEIHPEIVHLYGDDFQIQRLLTNLLTNAIRYTVNNAKIYIKVLPAAEKFAEISIIDTGKGVPEKDLPHLFDKYFRVKQKNQINKGFGLGLYICKIIVKAHGGKIWANNNEQGGLSIHFTLPWNI